MGTQSIFSLLEPTAKKSTFILRVEIDCHPKSPLTDEILTEHHYIDKFKP